MALPVVKTATECADFSSTVLPYIYQLRPLPEIIYESISNLAALKQIYVDTNPLISAFAFSLFLFPLFLIGSEINKNYSQVDRFWSILPTVYNAHYAIYAHMTGLETKRIDTLLAASGLWSARLTFNYWRKGGYSIGSEDYRWEALKEKIGQPLFFLFNVTFISLAQSVLLFLVTTPTYILLLHARLATASSTVEPWNDGDLIASNGMAAMVLVAFFADQQQWDYQKAKAKYLKTAKIPSGFEREDLDRGFVTTGLWAFSRHPNFFAEQSFWVGLYQWSCWTSGTMLNWTGVGALGYLALFQGSTWFTELLSSRKYPDYKEYQRQVARFVGIKEFRGIAKKTVVNKDAVTARKRYDLR